MIYFYWIALYQYIQVMEFRIVPPAKKIVLVWRFHDITGKLKIKIVLEIPTCTNCVFHYNNSSKNIYHLGFPPGSNQTNHNPLSKLSQTTKFSGAAECACTPVEKVQWDRHWWLCQIFKAQPKPTIVAPVTYRTHKTDCSSVNLFICTNLLLKLDIFKAIER